MFFPDFRSSGQVVLKTNAKMEIVPVKNVFYGPIKSQVLRSGGYVIDDRICTEIREYWLKYCSYLEV